MRAYFEKHGLTFDQYYCTTTERASDTLELATGVLIINVLRDLKRCTSVSLRGNPEYLHPKNSNSGHFGDHYAQFGGESQDQFVERVVNGAREIVDKTS